MPAKILFVQGEVEIRQFISEALQKAGYEVVAPIDSYVALETACESEFDLVAVSPDLPLIGGPAFVELLRENGIHIPAVVLYNQMSEEEKHRFEILSVQTFLKMPFHVEDLLKTVESLLNTG